MYSPLSIWEVKMDLHIQYRDRNTNYFVRFTLFALKGTFRNLVPKCFFCEAKQGQNELLFLLTVNGHCQHTMIHKAQ